MKFSGARRFGVVGAAVVAMLGALVVAAPSASAVTTFACLGEQTELDRCIEVIYNEEYRTIRAHGLIEDRTDAGSHEYTVWLRDLKVLHETPTGTWEVIRHVPDLDGSFDVRDDARTSTFKPCNYSAGKTFGIPTFRVKATYYWRGHTDGHATFLQETYVLAPWSC